MLKKPLSIETLLLLASTGVLNQIAVNYNLYWQTSEFDSLVHFFGGATASLFFLWLYFFSGFFNSQRRSFGRFLQISLLGTVFIAVSWEVFELLLGEASIVGSKYPFDTTMDLIMDLLGALAACLYGFLKEMKKENFLLKNE